jgi:hypothetical protein
MLKHLSSFKLKNFLHLKIPKVLSTRKFFNQFIREPRVNLPKKFDGTRSKF